MRKPFDATENYMRYLFLILILFCAVLQAAQPVIPIEKYTLKNGMRVILSRDNAVPVVTVYMIFDYGVLDGTKGANKYGPSPKGAIQV